MGEQVSLSDIPPQRVLRLVRLLWLMLVLGQLLFLGVLMVVILPGRTSSPQPILFWINVGMLATIVPATFLVRTMMFQKAEVEGGMPGSVYAVGSLIFWAGCEGVSMFGLLVVLLNNSLMPTIVIVAIALGLQAITFPVSGRIHQRTQIK